MQRSGPENQMSGRGEVSGLNWLLTFCSMFYIIRILQCINFQISNSNTLRKFCIELAAIVNTLGLIVVQFSFV